MVDVMSHSSSKKRKMSLRARIAQGDIRIWKLHPQLQMKYQGIPNRYVFPHYGMGTGCDFIVWQYSKIKPKIFELREVLNWDKFTCQGKKEEVTKERKDNLIKSLTKTMYWVKWGNSSKRLYPTSGTIRFLDISYKSNLPSRFWNEFHRNRIDIMVWGRRETKKGWYVEDNQGKKIWHKGSWIPTRILGARGR
jgi:hypothetical protein